MRIINTSTQQVMTYDEFKSLYPNTSFPRDMTLVPLTDYDCALVHDTERPEVTDLQKVVEGAPELVDGQWQQTWQIVDRYETLDDAKVALKRMASAHKPTAEYGGMTLTDGTQIATGEKDQARIAHAVQHLRDKAEGSTLDFKAESGWVTMDLPTLEAIKLAVGDHVQACFTAEKNHHVAIDALTTMEEAGAYDVTSGWPA